MGDMAGNRFADPSVNSSASGRSRCFLATRHQIMIVKCMLTSIQIDTEREKVGTPLVPYLSRAPKLSYFPTTLTY